MKTLNNQVSQEILEALMLNVKLSTDLLSLLHRETEALKSMVPQELLNISKQKTTLLTKIQFIDESLKNHMLDSDTSSSGDTPSTDYGNSTVSEQYKLSGLIGLLPPDKTEAANQCKKKLNKIRQDILIKNYINKKFTEDTLSYLGDAIGLFTQPVTKKNTYSAVGNSPKGTSSLPQLISKKV